ncbi:uncharacterized protein LOC106179304 [Lingula anatina]|uniref:Uncharacterized protein LOC106179304 n=1 Tax=Lingula anatina TaxID=7574 RepID=A0A1S3K799_LINAN|nr:uncharacterized protein LOC106179304 [Lingula anatina]XP_013418319.1 uncharacterized protein LOC106179304 [Lingula anatina]XP_013418320.1 uncharacterized protein LOC106179304 [Lingula anatina]|eukprot:XP_013418318.1 uncharacterized protein LOC106179304 [Lingula anatina]
MARHLLLWMYMLVVPTVIAAVKEKKHRFYYMDGTFNQCRQTFKIHNDTMAVVTAWIRTIRYAPDIPSTCTLTFTASDPSMILRASFSAIYMPCSTSSRTQLNFYDGDGKGKLLRAIHCNTLALSDILSGHNSMQIRLHRGQSIDYDFKFTVISEKAGLTFGQSSAIIVSSVIVIEVAIVVAGCYIKRRRARARARAAVEGAQIQGGPAGVYTDPPPYDSICIISSSVHNSRTRLLYSEEHNSDQPPPPYSRDIERLCSFTAVRPSSLKVDAVDSLPRPTGVPPPSYCDRISAPGENFGQGDFPSIQTTPGTLRSDPGDFTSKSLP